MNDVVVAMVVVLAGVCGSARAADDGGGYEEFMRAPAITTTVKSLCVAIMASPYRGDAIEQELWKVWWANQADVIIEPEAQAIAAAQLRRQIAAFRDVVSDRRITRLTLAGFNTIGTKKVVDVYLAAETNEGPVIFRASVTFHHETGARLHQIATFVGWDDAREADAEIELRPGDAVFNMNFKPPVPGGDADAADRPDGA